MGHFLPNNPERIKTLKKEKSIWKCHQFTQAYTCNLHNFNASWDVECFFIISDHFFPFSLPLPPPLQPRKNSEKIKKHPQDIIILHMCTINEIHIMYIWFLRYEALKTEFFVILGHSLAFYPTNIQKNLEIS